MLEAHNQGYHVHLISDSTGETIGSVARACLALFENVNYKEHHWSLIRTVSQLNQVFKGIEEFPGPVLFTIVDDTIRKGIEDFCKQKNLIYISILDQVISSLESAFDTKITHQPGRQHFMNDTYFSRIEAMQFALDHDDGQNFQTLYKADVILIGVSRTSKSPTCLYLANKGVKAANVPFVLGVELPEIIHNLGRDGKLPLVFGLTKSPEQLVHVRRNRLRMLDGSTDSSYVDIEKVQEEVKVCKMLCQRRGWYVIDVGRRSIEETAASILTQLERNGWGGND